MRRVGGWVWDGAENGQKVSMLAEGEDGQQAGKRARGATGLSASVV